MKGNSQPRFPEWSGNATATYRAPIGGNGWEWYARGDVSYFGKAFVDESNLAWAKGYFLTNARVGFERDDLRLELFVTNLFDNQAYAAAARWTDWSIPTNFATLTNSQGVAASPLDKRDIGVRMIAKF
jgi:hypothetical protein